MSTSNSELGIKEEPPSTPSTPSTLSTKDLKRDYQIAISQDGKLAATFDTVNLQIKVLENTDYRPFKFETFENDPPQIPSESEMINKTITHFKIGSDLVSPEEIKYDGANDSSRTTKGEDQFRWSFDISNSRDKGYILIAVSHIKVDMKKKDCKNNTKVGYLSKTKCKFEDKIGNKPEEIKEFAIDMPVETEEIAETEKTEKTKGNTIHRLELEKSVKEGTTIYCLELEEKNNIKFFQAFSDVSGICKFIDVPDKSENNKNVEQERFVILNYHGIYNFEIDDSHKDINFKLNDKFYYPKSIENELKRYDSIENVVNRLRSCIYNKYFVIVTQDKNYVQSLEVYNLAKMELETAINEVNYDTCSVGSLQFCFTQGINRVMLYYIENGLQITTKKFNQLKKIHRLEFIENDKKILIIGEGREEKVEFIIWDLYNTGKVDKPIVLDTFSIEDIEDRLATTPGNILHVDDNGNVTSVLKKIENKLKESRQEKESKPDRDAELIKNNDNDKHKIYYDQNTTPNFNEDSITISNFNKVADGIEPWVSDYCERNSYCLYYNRRDTQTEFLQLTVCSSTVQIWHQISDNNYENNDQLPNKGNPFLEYIWANGIPVDQESEKTKLKIEEFKYGSNNVNDESNKDGLNDGKNWSERLSNFSLKVSWYIRKTKMESEKRTMVIKLKDIIETFHPIRHACKALKHFNKRRKDNKHRHKYVWIVTYIEHTIWRFAKHNPEQFKLLDVRYDFMKSLILGDCDCLIKFILFGDEGNIDNNNEKEKKEREKIRHIPKNVLWPGKKFIKDYDLNFNVNIKDMNENGDHDYKEPENDLELAIYHCRGRELKDAIIVAYLLEYYSEHAKDYAGWMCTVSKALPLLFKYHYDDYIRKFFRKQCFVSQNPFLVQNLEKENPGGLVDDVIKFRVLAKQPIIISKFNKRHFDMIDMKVFFIFVILTTIYIIAVIIQKIMQIILQITYVLLFGKNDKNSPLAFRIVPLPDFTVNSIPKKRVEHNFTKIILNIFRPIFIPRQYQIKRNERNKLSPFSRMILYENNEDIYDNPAIVAIIDFHWQEAKNFLFLNFIRILIFGICFGIVSWEYLVHEVISEGYRNFLFVPIVIFYYLAIYLLVTEIFQLRYRGLNGYFNLFNFFDLCSIVLPVIVMSIIIKEFQFSNGFGNVETVNIGLVVGISFSIFLFWIELIFHFRLISRIGIYLYYSIIIFRKIIPFFFFMIITIFAFAHSVFILLRDPVNISTKDQTLSGNATDVLTNQTLNIQLKSDFDPKSSIDNPFSSIPTAFMAAYFWINGNWIQRDEFDFWAVDLYTIIASVVLVIFIQNLLIAYMGGMHDKADAEGRQILLRHRARFIADYEALNHENHECESKYIHYFGRLKDFEGWLKEIKDDQNAIYEGFENKFVLMSHNNVFKEDYDENSILVYDDDETKIEKIKNMKNDINVNFEDLIELFSEFKDKGGNEIEKIEEMKSNADIKIGNLIKKIQ